MKRLSYLFTAVLSLGLLASCSKETSQDTDATATGRHVVISMGAMKTRASSPSDILSKTADVDNIVIFVTNPGGKILKKVEVNKDLTGGSDWDKLTDAGLLISNVGADASDVAIYGNYKKGSETYVTGAVGDAVTVACTFDQQQGSKVLYSGSAALSSFGITVENANQENIYTYTGSVTIKPVMARIQIKTVSFVESGSETVTNNSNGETASIEWTGLDGKLLGVYLNNFYKQFNGSAVTASLMKNTTAFERVKEGKWLFGADATETDEAAFASYNQWSAGVYTPYDLAEFNTPANPDDKKCFAFNFFPDQVPNLHLNLGDVTATTITSDNHNAYNPSLLPLAKFVNIINYTSTGTDVVFEAGKIYNVNIEIEPQFMHTDINPVAYNILLKVVIADWLEEDIDPEFQQR